MEQFAAMRHLPSVDLVLKTVAADLLRERFGRAALTDAVRAELDDARRACRAGMTEPPPDPDQVAIRAKARLEAMQQPGVRTVFNLSGVVLHTNLGRAVLAE